MFERMANGWRLAKCSFRVINEDRKLLVFPALSGLACLLVLASFALPMWNSGYLGALMEQEEQQQKEMGPVFWVVLFLFYFINYFIIAFFNSALVACALVRLSGGAPTVGLGLRTAASRAPKIFGWALLSATVGVVLRAIESRSETVGRFVAGLIGLAWTVVSYFVVPVLVVENLGPFAAVKRSAQVLRKTWGEALVSNIGIEFVVFLLALVAIIPAALGFLTGSAAAVWAGVAVSVVLLVILSLVVGAARAVLIAALYQYAAEGTMPQQFDEQAIQGAFKQKT